jgi:hypothetical protein
MIAAQPPASGGASREDETNGVRANTARTILCCTPVPRPWMIRTVSKSSRFIEIGLYHCDFAGLHRVVEHIGDRNAEGFFVAVHALLRTGTSLNEM